MVKGRHKSPARIRYEQSHPTISLRLDRDTYDLLKQRLEDLGVSAADFIKESLGLQQAKFNDIKEIRQTAFEEGYREAIENCQIWYFCNICGERINISPNDGSHKAMIGYMKEHGWGHTSCHRQ